MFRKGGKTEKRLRKLQWKFGAPAHADNRGIRLPLRHPAITAPIRKLIDEGFSLDFSCMRKNVYFLAREDAA